MEPKVLKITFEYDHKDQIEKTLQKVLTRIDKGDEFEVIYSDNGGTIGYFNIDEHEDDTIY